MNDIELDLMKKIVELSKTDSDLLDTILAMNKTLGTVMELIDNLDKRLRRLEMDNEAASELLA